jgi:hypothetical protein
MNDLTPVPVLTLHVNGQHQQGFEAFAQQPDGLPRGALRHLNQQIHISAPGRIVQTRAIEPHLRLSAQRLFDLSHNGVYLCWLQTHENGLRCSE